MYIFSWQTSQLRQNIIVQKNNKCSNNNQALCLNSVWYRIWYICWILKLKQ